jgi:hypothetical protein
MPSRTLRKRRAAHTCDAACLSQIQFKFSFANVLMDAQQGKN